MEVSGFHRRVDLAPHPPDFSPSAAAMEVMHSCGPYAGALVALATRHGKEQVIGPALRHGLGADLLHLNQVDTDRLGSFCGSIPRRGSAREACQAKLQVALEQGGTGFAIASEGSFGPHPAVPLLPVGQEWMLFRDGERGITIAEQLLSQRTNYAQLRLDPGQLAVPLQDESLQRWLQQVGFPRHGLIVTSQRPSSGEPVLVKGIREPQQLASAIARAAVACEMGSVRLETDMRAHCNPTRMASIRRLALRLVRRIATPCPSCASPGWGTVACLSGLPCGWCGTPTSLRRGELLGCVVCDYQQERVLQGGSGAADPSHCPLCNP